MLTPALARHPDHPDLTRECARLLLGMGGRRNYREGIRLAQAAVALSPEDPYSLALLGHGLILTVSRWAEAKDLMAQAVALAPNDPAIHLARARALAGISFVRYQEAREAALRAVELAPDDPEALLVLAEVEFDGINPLDQEAYARVDQLIGRVLGMDPGNAEATYLAARAKVSASPAERAAAYRAAVRLNPHNQEAIARVDSALVSPLRGGYWILWFLALLQAILLWRDIDWGGFLRIAVMVLVVAVPWWRFLLARRRSPDGFGKHDGVDPLLIGFGLLVYVGVGAFRFSTEDIGGGGALRVCFALLVLAGGVYLWRARRRRKRYGG